MLWLGCVVCGVGVRLGVTGFFHGGADPLDPTGIKGRVAMPCRPYLKISGSDSSCGYVTLFIAQ